MSFVSTRDRELSVSGKEAVRRGLSPDGGLFTVDIFPKIDVSRFVGMKYEEAASGIIAAFLPDFAKELPAIMEASVSTFENRDPAPLKKLSDGVFACELYRGRTCAFKDVALSVLPHLLKASAHGETVILTATSGDTGKAALAGFSGVAGTRIGVFYPKNGVSEIQKLQMTTQEGENVRVFGINGNFDDAQSGVKAIFGDRELEKRLSDRNIFLSSANSINFGRLAPQIAYYFTSYARLCEAGEIACGDAIDFVVPTGNFGNILAGYFAKRAGLPIGRLVCASNSNNVLTDFLGTGVYDRRRTLLETVSPSMDILVSSNLERLLFALFGDKTTKKLMEDLKNEGKYALSAEQLEKIRAEGFCGVFADEGETLREISSRFNAGYLCDTHTAVALAGLRKLGTERKTVVLSTASPFKFAQTEVFAIEGRRLSGFDAIERLSQISGQKVPAALAELRTKKERFTDTTEISGMKAAVEGWLL